MNKNIVVVADVGHCRRDVFMLLLLAPDPATVAVWLWCCGWCWRYWTQQQVNGCRRGRGHSCQCGGGWWCCRCCSRCRSGWRRRRRRRCTVDCCSTPLPMQLWPLPPSHPLCILLSTVLTQHAAFRANVSYNSTRTANGQKTLARRVR